MADVVCRGSLALGSGCGHCARCDEERKRNSGLVLGPVDVMTIRRVVNGWVIMPGAHAQMNDFTHVASSPAELAKHVEKWATAQGAIG